MIGVRKKAGQAPKKAEAATRRIGKAGGAGASARPRRSTPQTTPITVPRNISDKPRAATSSRQARARAKARKAKAPKIIRVPLRERIIARLVDVDLRPQVWISKVPFVVLVIGALGFGLAITLWLSTDAAERSYQLGAQRRTNEALIQHKEALERDVLRAESAPALADSARDLGMIPSRDVAHLIQDPQGNWLLVGSPKPAEGVAPPPLNIPIPDDANAVPKAGNSVEVPVQLPPAPPPAPAAPASVPHMPALAPAPDTANVPAAPDPAAQPLGQNAATPPVPLVAATPVDPAIPAPAPLADAPQAPNSTNSPATGEQFNAVATTNPNVPA